MSTKTRGLADAVINSKNKIAELEGEVEAQLKTITLLLKGIKDLDAINKDLETKLNIAGYVNKGLQTKLNIARREAGRLFRNRRS